MTLPLLFGAFCFALLVLLHAGASLSAAAELQPPAGATILEVEGRIGITNKDDKALFDKAMLEAMPADIVRTRTPWTDGEQVFRGVRLVSLLQALQATGDVVRLTALNDYSIEMDLRLFLPYQPLIAYERNGEPMPVFDKGPLWVVFPQDDNPSIDRAEVHDYWVWQLHRIRVR